MLRHPPLTARNLCIDHLHFQKKLKFVAEKLPSLARLIMTKKAELYSRRREMYRLYVSKLNMSEILEKLSTKYRVSKRTLCTDWQKRAQWVYAVFDLEPARAS